MPKFVTRLWVDIELEANSKEEAIKITHKVPVTVGNQDLGIEVYDIQVSGQVWERNKE